MVYETTSINADDTSGLQGAKGKSVAKERDIQTTSPGRKLFRQYVASGRKPIAGTAE